MVVCGISMDRKSNAVTIFRHGMPLRHKLDANQIHAKKKRNVLHTTLKNNRCGQFRIYRITKMSIVKAVCVLAADKDSGVSGTINFEQSVACIYPIFSNGL